MNCPKCNSDQIHVWIKCVCYKCGHTGDITEFNATDEEINNNFQFKKIITDMHHADSIGLVWTPTTQKEYERKQKKQQCSICGQTFIKRLMYGINIFDCIRYSHITTKYYCNKCAKDVFGIETR